MPHRLRFPDHRAAADAATFASRASRMGDGAVRLQAASGTLVMTCAPLAPRGLLDSTPTVLGLRASTVDPELLTDVVVDATALVVSEDPLALTLPDAAVSAPWAGVAPPRGGWEPAGTLDAATIATRAQWGIAAVAESVPRDAGDDAVRAVRASVWGAQDAALAGLPLGVAFAAFGLGFIGGAETVELRTAGPWTRLSLRRGHVLVRGPVKTGLTPVRATGTAA
ncbi:hypothetical protein NQ156_07530 [Microbacterium sp. zg.Y625]|uniref:hypothetical protein n=1 Tax=Microbacterium jiangjiandongii TaxID=3049071 RepID=UPI00214A90C2|nr:MULTISPECIES: hypothetical protein [unclassified Microbacterium]MCR2792909.1 hypothetical protein [Microbacterium sp. zg.Y625]MCR2814448.1 hypothetical protein [Microbacterium sp. zg.Y843]WIM24032.1 hypothetical protein QNO14_07555 [Microbacterium sp. zg-Y625]